MRTAAKLCALSMTLMLASGCSAELDTLAVVYGLGIGEEGASVCILKPPENGGEGSEVFHGEGASLEDALARCAMLAGRTLFFGHCGVIALDADSETLYDDLSALYDGEAHRGSEQLVLCANGAGATLEAVPAESIVSALTMAEKLGVAEKRTLQSFMEGMVKHGRANVPVGILTEGGFEITGELTVYREDRRSQYGS